MTDNADQVDGSFNKLISMIQALGYRAQAIENTSVPSSIGTAMSGFSVVVFHYPHHSVQMYTGFKDEGDFPFGLKQANEFNDENRFIKCYLARGGIRFEGDFFFDIDDDCAEGELNKIFRAWEISLSFASESMNKAQEQASVTDFTQEQSSEQSVS